MPLLEPMSEIAGRMSTVMGASFLAKHNGGSGVLLGGVPGVLPGRVVVVGGGTSGVNAARMATGLGADVTILDIDLERIVAEVEAKMAHRKEPLRISILGCMVNGFGEAKEADLGIAAGSGKGVIFKRGVPIRHVKESEMVQALLEEVERFHEETPALKPHLDKKKSALPVLN